MEIDLLDLLNLELMPVRTDHHNMPSKKRVTLFQSLLNLRQRQLTQRLKERSYRRLF